MRPPEPRRRIRSGLRRHGLVRRPRAVREIAGAKDLRFTDGNALRAFTEGRSALDSMFEAIAGATRRVHLETYILRSDDTGRRFLDELAARSAEGVDVRVLYDAIGSRGLDERALGPLRETGGLAVAFNPLGRIWPRFAPRRRDHRKILVVDGHTGFIGGLNIGDEYANDQWRDAHVRAEGPVVRQLEAVFLESWFRADAPDLDWSAFFETVPSARGSERCAVLADGPVYRRRAMLDLLVSALGGAREEALLVSPYFAPGRRMLEAIGHAARNGARVELLLAGKTDHGWLRRASRSILPRLLEAGVRVHEYQRSMMHAKLSVFDDAWAVIGTSNLDRQSLAHSYEVNLVVDGGPLPRKLRSGFARDLDAAKQVDGDALAARGLRDRLIDWLAARALLLL